MTIYEPEDSNRIWNTDWMKFNRSVDKLRKMRQKIDSDKERKAWDNTPTAFELECWLAK